MGLPIALRAVPEPAERECILGFASPQGEGAQNVDATWMRARLHDRPVFVDGICMSDFQFPFFGNSGLAAGVMQCLHLGKAVNPARKPN